MACGYKKGGYMSNDKKVKRRKAKGGVLSPKNDKILDLKKAGIEPRNDDEIFIQIEESANYYISNDGRIVNFKADKYRLLKETRSTGNGKVHYKLSLYDTGNNHSYWDVQADYLVARTFLEKIDGKSRIWHIDGNKHNSYYKNLIYISDKEHTLLQNNNISIDELIHRQEYVLYISNGHRTAYMVYNGIFNRCYRTKESGARECYENAYMYEGWLKDPDLFAEWYEYNYYDCDGESMAVDKDLLFPGNKEYSPYKCCILPQTLNTMLSNCKKHRGNKWRRVNMDLPLGVRYDERLKMYHGQIKLFGFDEIINLSYWDTPEEAFKEYKRHKQADILIMADRYKSKIPRKIYDALLRVEVKPFVDD